MRSHTTAWVVVLTAVGSLMAALDTLVVSTALTTIRADLGASLEQLQWTVNAYNIAFAVLLLTGAALGDRFGRRRGYATGLVVFAVASAACALAPSAGWLIAARALQGAGAALLMPLGLALLTAAFPPERRGAAIGLYSAVTGLAVASGPLIGGAVVEGLDWPWVFWLNVPIGLAAAPLVLSRLPEHRAPRTAFDLPGLLLVSAGALGVVWALVRGNAAGWDSAQVLGPLLGGLAAGVAFVAWERRAPAPMLPLTLFRSRAVSAGNAAIFCTFAALFGCVFLFPQMLQVALRDGPLDAGLRLVPWTVTFLTVAPVAGTLADRFGPRPFLAGGLALNAGALAWIAVLAGGAPSYGDLLPALVLAGVGVSMAIPSAQGAAVGAVADAEIGQAAGVNSMVRELGGVFGIAVAVAAFSGAGSSASPAAFLDGFGPGVAVTAGLALAGAAVALAVPGRGTAKWPVAAAAQRT